MSRDTSLYRYKAPGYCVCEDCDCIADTDNPAGLCDSCADGRHFIEIDACAEHKSGCGNRAHTRFAEAQ